MRRLHRALFARTAPSHETSESLLATRPSVPCATRTRCPRRHFAPNLPLGPSFYPLELLLASSLAPIDDAVASPCSSAITARICGTTCRTNCESLSLAMISDWIVTPRHPETIAPGQESIRMVARLALPLARATCTKGFHGVSAGGSPRALSTVGAIWHATLCRLLLYVKTVSRRSLHISSLSCHSGIHVSRRC
jgi:hypothetical protein